MECLKKKKISKISEIKNSPLSKSVKNYLLRIFLPPNHKVSTEEVTINHQYRKRGKFIDRVHKISFASKQITLICSMNMLMIYKSISNILKIKNICILIYVQRVIGLEQRFQAMFS